MALALDGVAEGAHMGHPDFRVRGRIFATLGWPARGSAMVKVSPLRQEDLVREHPRTFAPASGAWGRAGSTIITLRGATPAVVREALEAAWRGR